MDIQPCVLISLKFVLLPLTNLTLSEICFSYVKTQSLKFKSLYCPFVLYYSHNACFKRNSSANL